MPKRPSDPVTLPSLVKLIRYLEVHLITNPSHRYDHGHCQSVCEAAVQLQLRRLAAGLQLCEGLGERSEYPQNEHRVQHRHRQHEEDARRGGEVVDGADVGHHVQRARSNKVRRPQRNHFLGQPAQRGAHHAIAHGHYQQEHAGDALARRANHHGPQCDVVRTEAGVVEVYVVKVPGGHLHHAQGYHRGDEDLQRLNLAPFADVLGHPQKAHDHVGYGHHPEEGKVGGHHAWQVSPRVLPGGLPADGDAREVGVTDDEPQVKHPRVRDGHRLVHRVRHRVVVREVNVRLPRPVLVPSARLHDETAREAARLRHQLLCAAVAPAHAIRRGVPDPISIVYLKYNSLYKTCVFIGLGVLCCHCLWPVKLHLRKADIRFAVVDSFCHCAPLIHSLGLRLVHSFTPPAEYERVSN
mmetsp:Transcript_16139/g.31012  ORF Transcript_16139/g.31012 Transcript_16139/m.31012 type:complete len:410 (-) Transcript_16139:379-1608(-)